MAAAVRAVAFRLSMAEMVVPYGDPKHPHYLKNAFDAGEDGLGRNAHSLKANGCDCLGHVEYLDAQMVDALSGRGRRLPNAVCVHEEDTGMLWKHMDWRTSETEVRRGRRLVVSFVCTIANYEYGFYWQLGMDGTIRQEVRARRRRGASTRTHAALFFIACLLCLTCYRAFPPPPSSAHVFLLITLLSFQF